MDEAAAFAPLRRRYMEAVWAFVAHGGEELRERAFSLGREALEAGLGILDLALLQKDAAGGLEPGPAQDRAAEFFAEALAPYEMRLRGVQEANARLKDVNADLERRVDERTRGLREKEAQLQQARKMEAIGRLAGGVAHDFNNLLTVICGYIDICLESGGGGAAELRRARQAADQAAALTRQLLSFSRRQVNTPRVLDLNAQAGETLAMLGRLVGASVALEFKPAAVPCPILADPGQLSQVLMNLVINAKDALPEGGRIVVETAVLELEAGQLYAHPDLRPGAYVLLSVSDNGTGMDEETRARVFEPFFTTKEGGRGTGLGLATVYAIVEQARGFVALDSAPGRGTTFKIYLPRSAESSGRAVEASSAPPGPTPREPGRETVLLVEDDAQVRGFSRTVLASAGYDVLAADRPSRALQLLGRHGGELHLLVTDMMMPEMDGRALFKRLRSRNPALKALFLSGFPAGQGEGAADAGAQTDYLPKPFAPSDLKQRVRALLDGPAVGGPS